jgi:hypothetical protein
MNRRELVTGMVAGVTGATALAGGAKALAMSESTGKDENGFHSVTSSAATRTAWHKDRIGAMVRNVELIGFSDLGGEKHAGYQMAMQEVNGRVYLYCCHWAVNGISVLDVTDPSKPKLIRFVPEPSGKTGISMVKLQVADGIGITHMQQRKFEQFHGHQKPGTEYDEGLLVWDFKDPENPKVISRWHTETPWGTHRNFYNGGRYAHLTAGAPGYKGFIYRILDLADPAHPVVVGQWAHPEQPTDNPNQPVAPNDPRHIELHMPYIEGNRAYLAYWGIGMVILDISDVKDPKYIGTLRTHPPIGGGSNGASSHTIVPLTKRNLAIVSTEGERPFSLDPNSTEGLMGLKGKQQPMSMIGISDITNPAEPLLLSICPRPVPPPGSIWGNDYSRLNGTIYPFGNHNVHQPEGRPELESRDDRIYCAYFQAGLRVFDIQDPYAPKEIAAYCPPDPKKWNWQKPGFDAGFPAFPGPLTMCAEDIIVDRRGNIYMTNCQDGLHIMRVTV